MPPTTGASPITPPVRHMARRRLAPTRWLQIWPRNFVRTILRRFFYGWVPPLRNTRARPLVVFLTTTTPSLYANHTASTPLWTPHRNRPALTFNPPPTPHLRLVPAS